MTQTCPECGAQLPEGGTCRDLFHRLLLLEHEVVALDSARSTVAGPVAHFYAVSAYVLQHPLSTNYKAEALDGARQGLEEHLTGKITLAAQRQKVRRAVDGSARILRRPGDPVVQWPVVSWPVTVADVLSGGAGGYGERARAWAASVIQTLNVAEA